jgi:hypothetical protein
MNYRKPYEMIMRELNGMKMKNDFIITFLFVCSRSGDVQLDAFVLQDTKITLLDVLWIAIAYGKMNKRTDGIESMMFND